MACTSHQRLWQPALYSPSARLSPSTGFRCNCDLDLTRLWGLGATLQLRWKLYIKTSPTPIYDRYYRSKNILTSVLASLFFVFELDTKSGNCTSQMCRTIDEEYVLIEILLLVIPKV